MFTTKSTWLSAYGFELNNRELATLFWLAILAVFALSKANIRSGLLKVLRSVVVPKLAIVWFAYIAWILFFVGIADWFGFWRTELTKNTLVWMVTTGLVILGGIPKASQPGFFRRTVLKVISVVVILEYIINLSSFSLWVEIIMQPVITLIFVAPIVVRGPQRQKRWCQARDCFSIIFISLLLSHTVITLNTSSEAPEIELIVLQAIWPISLGLWVLVLVFGLAVVATYEQAFIKLQFSRRENRGVWKVKVGLVLALRLRLKYIREAARRGPIDVARADSVTEAYDAASSFKDEF